MYFSDIWNFLVTLKKVRFLDIFEEKRTRLLRDAPKTPGIFFRDVLNKQAMRKDIKEKRDLFMSFFITYPTPVSF